MLTGIIAGVWSLTTVAVSAVEVGTLTTLIHSPSVYTVVQEDRFSPGNLITAHGNSIASVTKTGVLVTLAGSATIQGYRDGNGHSARFTSIFGLYQMDDRRILISDYGANCVRIFNRRSSSVSRYAGRCGLTDSTQSNLLSATFSNPGWMAPLNDSHILVSELWGGIKAIDTVQEVVSTLIPSEWFLGSHPRSFVVAADGSLFIAVFPPKARGHAGGVMKYSTGRLTWLVKSGSADFGAVSLLDTVGILMIAPDIFLVADLHVDRLMKIDLHSKQIVQICSDVKGTRDGNMSNCQLLDPWTMAAVGPTVYVGQVGSIRKLELTVSSRSNISAESVTDKISTSSMTAKTQTPMTRIPRIKNDADGSNLHIVLCSSLVGGAMLLTVSVVIIVIVVRKRKYNIENRPGSTEAAIGSTEVAIRSQTERDDDNDQHDTQSVQYTRLLKRQSDNKPPSYDQLLTNREMRAVPFLRREPNYYTSIIVTDDQRDNGSEEFPYEVPE